MSCTRAWGSARSSGSPRGTRRRGGGPLLGPWRIDVDVGRDARAFTGRSRPDYPPEGLTGPPSFPIPRPALPPERLAQFRVGDLEVDRRAGDRPVSEGSLNDSQIPGLPKQPGSEGVPERVGMAGTLASRLPQPVGEPAGSVAARDGTRVSSYEQVPGLAFRAVSKEVIQEIPRQDHSLDAVVFAGVRNDDALLEVHVLQPEPEGGRETHAAVEEEVNPHVVPPRHRPLRYGQGVHQPFPVLIAQSPGRWRTTPGTPDQPGRILAGPAGGVNVREEGPQARPQRVHAGRLLAPAQMSRARLWRDQETREQLVPQHVHVVTVALLRQPGAQQRDVAAVLRDGVLAPAIGLELHDEAIQGVGETHGCLLGVRAWRCRRPTSRPALFAVVYFVSGSGADSSHPCSTAHTSASRSTRRVLSIEGFALGLPDLSSVTLGDSK